MCNKNIPENNGGRDPNIEREEFVNIIETQRRKILLMEEENIKLFNEKTFFKEDSENAFKHSKDLEVVFQITVVDLKRELHSKHLENQRIRSELNTYKDSVTSQQTPEAPSLQVPALQVPPLQEASPQAALLQEADPQVKPPLWRPFEEKEVDECILNVRCEGDCTHVECKQTSENISSNETKTCNNCKQVFSNYNEMMDHRKQNHPSKKLCWNKLDCVYKDRTPGCWYMHPELVQTQQQITTNSVSAINDTNFTCKTCKTNFSTKNDMMMHKKNEHNNNVICKDFIQNSCRRGKQGEHCWYSHTPHISSVPDIESRQDFPQIPTSQTGLVGYQNPSQRSQMKNQLMMNMMNMMTQFMNMNMVQ